MFRLIFILTLSFLVVTVQSLGSESQSNGDWDLNTSWIVSPKQAKTILTQKGSILLDPRNLIRRMRYSLTDSKTVNWQDWSETKSPHKGNLLPKEKGRQILQSLSINEDSYIIVVGAGKDGWGEEGRIVYSLREWGFNRSYWVDGGDTFLLAEKSKIDSLLPLKSTYSISSYSISRELLSQNLKSQSLSIIDTREKREFDGSTPYGENRGGHIPGAHWIYFKDFLTSEGKVKSKEEIHKLLIKNNIKIENNIVTYCTGGVRSAFVTGILISYGITSKNYAGSMWEWSAENEKDFPLDK